MKKKELRVERFLNQMDQIMPWGHLLERLSPYYKSGEGGRPSHDLLLLLKVHFLQQWHNLSDPAMEEAIYDRISFQEFLGFDCFGGIVPDETSICRFRHFLEEQNLSGEILACVNEHLASQGLVLKEGTIVDATLLSAPISKKNAAKERDPEMSSTKKNNKWYFGAKAHIGVQAQGRPIVHSTHFTTAKVNDIKGLPNLLHGEEKALFGDSGYTNKEHKRWARAVGFYYGIQDRGARGHPLSPSQKKQNRKHSSLRAKVEYPFRIIKYLWGHYKLRYRGLFKNACQWNVLCALCNLFMCRRSLLKTTE